MAERSEVVGENGDQLNTLGNEKPDNAAIRTVVLHRGEIVPITVDIEEGETTSGLKTRIATAFKSSAILQIQNSQYSLQGLSQNPSRQVSSYDLVVSPVGGAFPDIDTSAPTPSTLTVGSAAVSSRPRVVAATSTIRQIHINLFRVTDRGFLDTDERCLKIAQSLQSGMSPLERDRHAKLVESTIPCVRVTQPMKVSDVLKSNRWLKSEVDWHGCHFIVTLSTEAPSGEDSGSGPAGSYRQSEARVSTASPIRQSINPQIFKQRSVKEHIATHEEAIIHESEGADSTLRRQATPTNPQPISPSTMKVFESLGTDTEDSKAFSGEFKKSKAVEVDTAKAIPGTGAVLPEKPELESTTDEGMKTKDSSFTVKEELNTAAKPEDQTAQKDESAPEAPTTIVELEIPPPPPVEPTEAETKDYPIAMVQIEVPPPPNEELEPSVTATPKQIPTPTPTPILDTQQQSGLTSGVRKIPSISDVSSISSGITSIGADLDDEVHRADDSVITALETHGYAVIAGATAIDHARLIEKAVVIAEAEARAFLRRDISVDSVRAPIMWISCYTVADVLTDLDQFDFVVNIVGVFSKGEGGAKLSSSLKLNVPTLVSKPDVSCQDLTFERLTPELRYSLERKLFHIRRMFSTISGCQKFVFLDRVEDVNLAHFILSGLGFSSGGPGSDCRYLITTRQLSLAEDLSALLDKPNDIKQNCIISYPRMLLASSVYDRVVSVLRRKIKIRLATPEEISLVEKYCAEKLPSSPGAINLFLHHLVISDKTEIATRPVSPESLSKWLDSHLWEVPEPKIEIEIRKQMAVLGGVMKTLFSREITSSPHRAYSSGKEKDSISNSSVRMMVGITFLALTRITQCEVAHAIPQMFIKTVMKCIDIHALSTPTGSTSENNPVSQSTPSRTRVLELMMRLGLLRQDHSCEERFRIPLWLHDIFATISSLEKQAQSSEYPPLYLLGVDRNILVSLIGSCIGDEFDSPADPIGRRAWLRSAWVAVERVIPEECDQYDDIEVRLGNLLVPHILFWMECTPDWASQHAVLIQRLATLQTSQSNYESSQNLLSTLLLCQLNHSSHSKPTTSPTSPTSKQPDMKSTLLSIADTLERMAINAPFLPHIPFSNYQSSRMDLSKSSINNLNNIDSPTNVTTTSLPQQIESNPITETIYSWFQQGNLSAGSMESMNLGANGGGAGGSMISLNRSGSTNLQSGNSTTTTGNTKTATIPFPMTSNTDPRTLYKQSFTIRRKVHGSDNQIDTARSMIGMGEWTKGSGSAVIARADVILRKGVEVVRYLVAVAGAAVTAIDIQHEKEKSAGGSGDVLKKEERKFRVHGMMLLEYARVCWIHGIRLRDVGKVDEAKNILAEGIQAFIKAIGYGYGNANRQSKPGSSSSIAKPPELSTNFNILRHGSLRGIGWTTMFTLWAQHGLCEEYQGSNSLSSSNNRRLSVRGTSWRSGFISISMSLIQTYIQTHELKLARHWGEEIVKILTVDSTSTTKTLSTSLSGGIRSSVTSQASTTSKAHNTHTKSSPQENNTPKPSTFIEILEFCDLLELIASIALTQGDIPSARTHLESMSRKLRQLERHEMLREADRSDEEPSETEFPKNRAESVIVDQEILELFSSSSTSTTESSSSSTRKPRSSGKDPLSKCLEEQVLLMRIRKLLRWVEVHIYETNWDSSMESIQEAMFILVDVLSNSKAFDHQQQHAQQYQQKRIGDKTPVSDLVKMLSDLISTSKATQIQHLSTIICRTLTQLAAAQIASTQYNEARKTLTLCDELFGDRRNCDLNRMVLWARLERLIGTPIAAWESLKVGIELFEPSNSGSSSSVGGTDKNAGKATSATNYDSGNSAKKMSILTEIGVDDSTIAKYPKISTSTPIAKTPTIAYPTPTTQSPIIQIGSVNESCDSPSLGATSGGGGKNSSTSQDRKSPIYTDIMYELGMVHIQLGDERKSRKALQECLRVRKSYCEWRGGMANPRISEVLEALGANAGVADGGQGRESGGSR
ncbi:hypothetical protein HDU76_000547 [Blyttiomyces sp. JEL0837]|nr:hypothetical protein HDU76_000547 [Blyttiomyces sp. JEL0837]